MSQWALMPGSVRLLLVLAVVGGLFTAFDFIYGSRPLLAAILRLGVLGLVIKGTLARHRLVWQWGRLGSMLAAAGAVAMLAVGLSDRNVDGVLEGLVVGAGSMALVVALGRRSAQSYFGLTCPACGTGSPKAADFLFRQGKCRRCTTAW